MARGNKHAIGSLLVVANRRAMFEICGKYLLVAANDIVRVLDERQIGVDRIEVELVDRVGKSVGGKRRDIEYVRGQACHGNRAIRPNDAGGALSKQTFETIDNVYTRQHTGTDQQQRAHERTGGVFQKRGIGSDKPTEMGSDYGTHRCAVTIGNGEQQIDQTIPAARDRHRRSGKRDGSKAIDACVFKDDDFDRSRHTRRVTDRVIGLLKRRGRWVVAAVGSSHWTSRGVVGMNSSFNDSTVKPVQNPSVH